MSNSIRDQRDDELLIWLRKVSNQLDDLHSAVVSNEPIGSEDIARIIDGWTWRMSADGRFVYVSPSLEKHTNLSKQDVVGKTRAELSRLDEAGMGVVAPVGFNADLMEIEDAVKRRLEFRRKRYYIIKNERAVLTQISGIPVFRNGHYDGYRGIGRRIADEVPNAIWKAKGLSWDPIFEEAMNALDVSILILRDDEILYSNGRWKALHVPRMPSKYIEKGVQYVNYLRKAVECNLFPDAYDVSRFETRENYIQWRLERNRAAAREPFRVARQNGIILSIKVTPLGESGGAKYVLVASTTISGGGAVTSWSEV